MPWRPSGLNRSPWKRTSNWASCYSRLASPNPPYSIQHILQMNPADAETHLKLGALFESLGRSAEALEHYQQAVRHKPDIAEAHGHLGMLFLSQFRLDEAIGAYQTALNLRPEYLDALINLGSALEQQGKPDDAAEQYAKALRVSPTTPTPTATWVCSWRTRQAGRSRWHLQKVVTFEPQNANAHYNLGNALLDLGEHARAAFHYAEVLTLHPGDEAASRKLALCQARQTKAATTGKVP